MHCSKCGHDQLLSDADVTPVTHVPLKVFKQHIAFEEATQQRTARYLLFLSVTHVVELAILLMLARAWLTG